MSIAAYHLTRDCTEKSLGQAVKADMDLILSGLNIVTYGRREPPCARFPDAVGLNALSTTEMHYFRDSGLTIVRTSVGLYNKGQPSHTSHHITAVGTGAGTVLDELAAAIPTGRFQVTPTVEHTAEFDLTKRQIVAYGTSIVYYKGEDTLERILLPSQELPVIQRFLEMQGYELDPQTTGQLAPGATVLLRNIGTGVSLMYFNMSQFDRDDIGGFCNYFVSVGEDLSARKAAVQIRNFFERRRYERTWHVRQIISRELANIVALARRSKDN